MRMLALVVGLELINIIFIFILDFFGLVKKLLDEIVKNRFLKNNHEL